MEDQTTIIYILEKCEDFHHGWDEIAWFTKSNLDTAEDQYETLEDHGFGNYRLREVTIGEDGTWGWKLHKHNYKANGED